MIVDEIKSPPTELGIVYFVTNGEKIKIGHTKDFATRLTKLRTDNDHWLKVLGWLPGGRPLEKEWHEKFSHLRQNGEWFADCEELRRAIFAVARTDAPPKRPPKPRDPRCVHASLMLRALGYFDTNPEYAEQIAKIADEYARTHSLN